MGTILLTNAALTSLNQFRARRSARNAQRTPDHSPKVVIHGALDHWILLQHRTNQTLSPALVDSAAHHLSRHVH